MMKQISYLGSLIAMLVSIAVSTPAHAQQNDGVMDADSQNALLGLLYQGLQKPLAEVGMKMTRAQFMRKMKKPLMSASRLGMLPSSIVLGYFSRNQFVYGKQYARQLNFYMDHGKVRVAVYDNNVTNIGPVVTFKAGLYAAFCFGSCAGGGNGSYVGVDVDVNLSPGADLFVEFGVDTTDYYEAKRRREHYSLSDLYSCKTFYLGIGLDEGIGGGVSLGFNNYSLLSEFTLIDLARYKDDPNLNSKINRAFERTKIREQLHLN